MPEWVDMLAVCGLDFGHRSKRSQWKHEGISVVQDTQRLVRSGVVSPKLSLSDARTPVISLVDALEEKGFLGRDALMVHTHRSGLYLGRMHVAPRQRYPQCVLAMAHPPPRCNRTHNS